MHEIEMTIVASHVDVQACIVAHHVYIGCSRVTFDCFEVRDWLAVCDYAAL